VSDVIQPAPLCERLAEPASTEDAVPIEIGDA
jgi:hypothetical protein